MRSDFWSLSLRNLRRNIVRNLATGSAIAFGFAGITLLGAYANRVSNYIRVHTIYIMHTGHIQIHKRDGLNKFFYSPRKFSLTPADQEKIDSVLVGNSNIAQVEKQLTAFGLIGNGCRSYPFVGRGVNPALDAWVQEQPEVKFWLKNYRFYRKGRGLSEFSLADSAVALSEGLSRALGKIRVHDEVGKATVELVDCTKAEKSEFAKDANVQMLSGTWSGGMGAVDGEIVGLFSTGFRESDNSALLTSTEKLQSLLDTDNLSHYVIWLKNPGVFHSDLRELRKKLPEYDVAPWDREEISPYYVGTIQFLYSLVTFIGVVLAAIIAFSVLNSATMTILERSQEIGMYRSFGFRKGHVQDLFFRECLWLSTLGLLAGSILGYCGVLFVNAAKIRYQPPGISDTIQLVLVWDSRYSIVSGVLILLLTIATTYFAVARQLRAGVADLLMGVKR